MDFELKVTVIDTRNEVDAQAKTPSAVAINRGKDAKHLETTDDVFDHDAVGGQEAVVVLVVGSEGMVLAGFLGAVGAFMVILEALKAGIRRTSQAGVEPDGRSLEQEEVVGLAGSKAKANNLTAVVVHDYLGLEGMALFLAAVALPLFFWGRSTGVSVTSIKMKLYFNSLCSRLRLPGRLNLPEPIRMPSTLLITRWMVGSLTP